MTICRGAAYNSICQGGSGGDVRSLAIVKARYLVDKSALARMPSEAVRLRLAPIIEAGEAATCSIIDLEVLFSERSTFNPRWHAPAATVFRFPT